MYRVLIADDEPGSLNYLEKLIENKCDGFSVCGRARNGQDAFEQAQKLHPDVVVTDIKMPILDGIGLAEKLYSAEEPAKLVIVSGYSDFSYAQSAIRLGVKDYLLKPILVSDIVKVMERLASQLDEQSFQEKKTIVRQLLSGKKVPAFQIHKFFPEKAYRLALIRWGGLPPQTAGYKAMEMFSDNHDLMFLYSRDEREGLYLCPPDLLDEERLAKRILDNSDASLRRQGWYTLLYTKEEIPVEHLSDMTEALYEALDQQIVLGKNRKLSLDQAKVKNADGVFELNALSMLEKYCQEKHLSKIKKELTRLLTNWNQEDRSQLWILRMLHRIAYLLQKYRVSVVRSIQQEESMLEEACFYAENLEQFVKDIMDVFFEDFTDLYDTQKLDTEEYYQAILRYMKEHMEEPLTLPTICKSLGVSQTYLNVILKKYGNESFNRCLTRLRMERAKELFRNQGKNTMIKDVAEAVGYKDQFYFSRLFRSFTGLCPTDYINQQQ